MTNEQAQRLIGEVLLLAEERRLQVETLQRELERIKVTMNGEQLDLKDARVVANG